MRIEFINCIKMQHWMANYKYLQVTNYNMVSLLWQNIRQKQFEEGSIHSRLQFESIVHCDREGTAVGA